MAASAEVLVMRTPLQTMEHVLDVFASEELTTAEMLTPALQKYGEAILTYLGIARRDWSSDPISALFSKNNTYQQDRFIAVALLRLLGKNSAAFEVPFRHH